MRGCGAAGPALGRTFLEKHAKTRTPVGSADTDGVCVVLSSPKELKRDEMKSKKAGQSLTHIPLLSFLLLQNKAASPVCMGGDRRVYVCVCDGHAEVLSRI